MNILGVNNAIPLAGNHFLSVPESLETNSNVLVVEAGSSKTVTPSFALVNGDKMVCVTPSSGTLIGTSFSFPVSVGEKIAFYPLSGDWDNLTGIIWDNTDFVFDLSILAGKFKNREEFRIMGCNKVTGDLIWVAGIKKRLQASSPHLTGTLSYFVGISYLLHLDSPLITGDLASVSTLTYYVRLLSPLITGQLLDVSNVSTYILITSQLITGLLSDQNASNWLQLASPYINGDLSDAGVLSGRLSLIGTAVTTNSGGAYAPQVYWHSSVTPIQVTGLDNLLQDLVNSSINDGLVVIGGSNPDITSPASIANITTLENRNFDVTYNSAA